MEKLQLTAQPRTVTGRPVKALRRAGLIPGVVYGHGFAPVNVQVPVKEFVKTYHLAGQSSLVYLDVDGQPYPTIIHAVARDAVSDAFQHADFYKVNLAEKIKAKVPLVFTDEAPAIKALGGILVKNITEIEVEGLPQDLPHKLTVSIAKLSGFGDQILVKDLALPLNLTLQVKPEEIIALIQEPISEEELKAQLETPTATAEEVEVIKRPSAEIEPGVEPGEAPKTESNPAGEKK